MIPNSMIVEGLQTERIQLRRLNEQDANALMEFFESEEALKYLKIKANDKTIPLEWIKRQMARYEKGSGLCAVIEKSTGTFIGQCGVMFQEVDGINEIEVGYHFIPRFWGKGFATEAAIACRNLAFNNNTAESIISIIDINNTPSQKVAERNGMKREKQTHWREFDVYVYRITKEEWAKIK